MSETGYLGGMLQNGQKTLLDTSDQFQSSVQVFWFQQPDTRGQVSALQQSLLWGHTSKDQSDQFKLYKYNSKW